MTCIIFSPHLSLMEAMSSPWHVPLSTFSQRLCWGNVYSPYLTALILDITLPNLSPLSQCQVPGYMLFLFHLTAAFTPSG